jgi:2-octaprenyl-6-methoxyphenol hydroxylase
VSQARILVLGGGLAGLSYAVALAQSIENAEITLLEAQKARSGAPNPLDTRASALNLHSAQLLTKWGLWDTLKPQAGAITEIHVSHQGHFGSALMSGEDVGESALGFVIENHLLGRALLERATELGVKIEAPVVCQSLRRDRHGPAGITAEGRVYEADLVLLAAGVDPNWCHALGIEVREREIGTRALSFNVMFAGAQAGRAFERFTPHGPLAVLPLPSTKRSEQRFNVVWSLPEGDTADQLALDDERFLEGFQEAFGWRLGRALAVGARSEWPLTRYRALEQYRAGYLLVGNAAHTLHPVAGQGLNLSLREAALLAAHAERAKGTEGGIEALAWVKPYLESSLREQSLVTESTDFLATVFNRRGPALDMPRNASLALLDMVPPVRQLIAGLGVGRRRA